MTTQPEPCARCGPHFHGWGTVDGQPYCHLSEPDFAETHHVEPHRFCEYATGGTP